MKHHAHLLGLLFALALGPSAARAATPLFVDATPSDSFKVYWLIRATEAPTIDGALDDPVWEKAEPLTDWGICNYGRQKGGLGEIDFRAAWDDTYLYIAARMYHRRNPQDMQEFRRQVSDVSKVIHSRECLEIHIDGNLDHATRFQSIVNALSEKWMCWFYDFGWGILENADYGLDADWDVAGSIEKDSWTVEARYALRDIQVTPRVGTMFGMNPCWFNWADSRDNGEEYWWQNMTWSTHGDSHHDPRLYGRFILVEDQPQTLEDGLRLAFGDLDARSLMIQSADGFLLFQNGKSQLQSYDLQVRRETEAARALLKRVTDLCAAGNTSGSGPIQKNLLPAQEEALKTIETALGSGDALSRGALAGFRRDLGTILSALDDAYWHVKQDVLLTALEAGD